MSQSSLIAAALFAMFVVFVAISGRLSTYTDVLWGGGGKGGGTQDPKHKSNTTDTVKKALDVYDKLTTHGDDDGGDNTSHDAAHILQAFLPYPFSIPFDLMDTQNT